MSSMADCSSATASWRLAAVPRSRLSVCRGRRRRLGPGGARLGAVIVVTVPRGTTRCCGRDEQRRRRRRRWTQTRRRLRRRRRRRRCPPHLLVAAAAVVTAWTRGGERWRQHAGGAGGFRRWYYSSFGSPRTATRTGGRGRAENHRTGQFLLTEAASPVRPPGLLHSPHAPSWRPTPPRCRPQKSPSACSLTHPPRLSAASSSQPPGRWLPLRAHS